jgi:hypothetical protein
LTEAGSLVKAYAERKKKEGRKIEEKVRHLFRVLHPKARGRNDLRFPRRRKNAKSRTLVPVAVACNEVVAGRRAVFPGAKARAVGAARRMAAVESFMANE